MTVETWGMPLAADERIVGVRVQQAAYRLARYQGEVTRELIAAWVGWVGSGTSDWRVFSANCRTAVERELVSGVAPESLLTLS